ncbi:L,D-transpeptidase [Microvirga sp. 2TAF3]|uniref:L,D-transpeptidase n=1 Tax=Microvirga sp. 2TAF3 TaxID=3233014 RepID=UPI003F9676DA
MNPSRRQFLWGTPTFLASYAFSGQESFAQALWSRSAYAAIYAPVDNDLYPIPGIELSRINPAFLRREVAYDTPEQPGTIVIDPGARYLYHVQEGGTAMRYGVGVGRAGFAWSGEATVHDKQEWPDWYPPKEMFGRRPDLLEQMGDLPGGLGMPGGPGNPLGARAMYLWQGRKDTLYRIHGTFEPWTIGTNASSGCIRMINQDAMDLYDRTPVGTRVVVLSPRKRRTRRWIDIPAE